MGIAAASDRGKARIRRVASSPSTNGIMISIRTKSNVPGAVSSNFFTASSPFVTSVTSTPASDRKQ